MYFSVPNLGFRSAQWAEVVAELLRFRGDVGRSAGRHCKRSWYPPFANCREGRGTHFVADAVEIKNTGHPPGKYYLPGIATLGNMMRDVSHNHAGKAGHGLKVPEMVELATAAE